MINLTVKVNSISSNKYNNSTTKLFIEDQILLSEFIAKLDIRKDQIGILLVNRKHAKLTDKLTDGDIVEIYPIYAGG